MADGTVDCEFPVWGLLPKRITGVESFVTKYPSYNGSDVVIAIFDSGVDPAAAGLQVTSNGEVKVVERFDCSGCGDVDTTTTCQLKDEHLTGITGRKLKVPSTWENPSGEWRLGVVYPFNLYPSKLKERVAEHRKEFLWDARHKAAVAAATKELQDFEAKHTSPSLSPVDKLLKEELETRVETLTLLEKKFNDVGPCYDCVLFFDGNVWRACIDTSEEGDLSKGVLLGEYSRTHEHKHLTELDQMTVSINVYHNGNLLEIVGMCSSHGTHVAAIASGYFPGEPEKNGVAPGAKIVSLSVGDSRLGSMETGTALVRACIKVMEMASTLKIDVINMSYGEHAHWANAGRIGDIISEVVNKYGVSWVVSAGNHGPALSTVGSPPDIIQPVLIGVGAYVYPDMMTAAYSMRSKVPGTVFSWSSRGPSFDGASGVNVCAPGGAITSVAHFTLRGSQLMNGTSMSAPHVAGVVALLVSGMKKNTLPYSPYSIKRALENSAQYLKDVEAFAQGSGLVNVEAAYNLLSENSDAPERDVRFSISCGPNNHKGIYLRDGVQNKARDVVVVIEPFFAANLDDPEGISQNPRKIDFNMKLSLCCDAPWVKYPAFLDMMNVSRSIAVRVEPEALPCGAHFASVKAYDIKNVNKGPVFQIPVTVIQPQNVSTENLCFPGISIKSYLFRPGTIQRHFVVVPDNASWAVLKLSTPDKDRSGKILVHCMQARPRQNCKSHEFQKLVCVSSQSETILPFQVKGGIVVEVALTKFWANLGDIFLDYTVEFHGITPDNSSIVMHGAEGLHCIHLKSLSQEECQPQASLKNSVQVLRPSESKLSPLTERDVVPPGKQIYETVNTYNFHIAKATEITPNASLLSDMLYESEFESQLWMLFDSNKQYLASGDAYPSKYSVKVEKGDYILKLNVRHDKKDILEKLSDLPLLLQHKLAQPISVDVYATHAQALTGGKKMVGGCIPPGCTLPIYLAPLPNDKIGKNLSIGQFMIGTITFTKDDLGKKVDSYTFKYVLPEPAKKTSNGANSKDKDKTKQEEYMEAIRDFKTNWLPKLEADQAQTLYDELVDAYPSHLGSHTSFMQNLDSPSDLRKLPSPHVVPETTEAACNKLISIADKIVTAVDQDKLLAYFGMKSDSRPDAAKIKSQNEKQRGYLLEALNKKGIALCKLYLLDGDNKPSMDQIAQIVTDIMKFVDMNDSKVLHFALWHSIVLEHWGRAIKILNKIGEEHSSKEVDDRLIKLYSALDWQHATAFTTSALPVKYPSAYRLF